MCIVVAYCKKYSRWLFPNEITGLFFTANCALAFGKLGEFGGQTHRHFNTSTDQHIRIFSLE
jgi:hypothetical protein